MFQLYDLKGLSFIYPPPLYCAPPILWIFLDNPPSALYYDPHFIKNKNLASPLPLTIRNTRVLAFSLF